MSAAGQDENTTLTRRHFDRLCRAILTKEPGEEPPASRSKFGRFELLSELGRGSFGIVWRARDPLLDREIALKILPPTLDSEDQKRLLREVRNAARLQHPGIVTVHELGEAEGRPVIVMEIVPGKPLGTVPLKNRRKIEVMIDLAETLEYAHAQGLVHRDLKPSNVLVPETGPPVLVDFGLARTIGRDARLTNTGAICGTPAYMSPEQAGGTPGEVDARSDLYSLGVMLYELLGGRLPHSGPTPFALTQAIVTEEPPRLRSVNRKVPQELEAIVHKAMAKRPGERYASAGVLAADLRSYLEGRPISAKPISTLGRIWRRARRRPAIPALALAGALLVAGAMWLGSRMSREDPGSPILPPMQPRPENPRHPGPPLNLEAYRRAAQAALEGDAARRDREAKMVREDAQRRRVHDPRDPMSYMALARLSLLEGKVAEAMGELDEGIRAGARQEEIVPLKCVIAILASDTLDLIASQGRFNLAAIKEDPLFKRARFQLHSAGAFPFSGLIEDLIQGRDREPRRPERRLRPETLFLHAIGSLNLHRYHDASRELTPLATEFPLPAFGAIQALAYIGAGRLDDANRALIQFSRLSGGRSALLTYVRGILLLERGRYQDCEREVKALPEGKIKAFFAGMVERAQGRRAEAARFFESCGDYPPALWHLAFLSLPDERRGMAYLEKAVSTAGELGRPGKAPIQLDWALGMPPFLILNRDALERNPRAKPFRTSPLTRDRFRKLVDR